MAKTYEFREPPSWTETVAGFPQDLDDNHTTVTLRGQCPRCEHTMSVDLAIEQRARKRLTNVRNAEPLGDKSFVKIAICNCRGDHPGRPEEIKSGCGAFGALDVG
jgi:hypothetical protein